MFIPFLLAYTSGNINIINNNTNKKLFHVNTDIIKKEKLKIKFKKRKIKNYKISIFSNEKFLYNFNKAMYEKIYNNNNTLNMTFLSYFIKNYYDKFSNRQKKNININMKLLLSKIKYNKNMKNIKENYIKLN